MENAAKIIREVTNQVIERVRMGCESAKDVKDAMIEAGRLKGFLVDEVLEERKEDKDDG